MSGDVVYVTPRGFSAVSQTYHLDADCPSASRSEDVRALDRDRLGDHAEVCQRCVGDNDHDRTPDKDLLTTLRELDPEEVSG